MSLYSDYDWSVSYKGNKLDMLREEVLRLSREMSALMGHLELERCSGGEMRTKKKETKNG